MIHLEVSPRTRLGVLTGGASLVFVGLLGFTGVVAHAAPPLPVPMPGTQADPAPDADQRLSAEALATLVGPIALYPDVILAGLLPATTTPLEVVAAAQYVREHGGRIEQVPTDRSWEPGVQTMLQYPEALLWMADNPEWLQQMGQAVALQQADVLKAIQDFRAAAQRAGNLQSDEHATVDAQGSPGVVVIEPVDPTIVYVPVYDPALVCVPHYRPAPLFTWDIGFSFGRVGPWCWNWIAWGGYGTGYGAYFGDPCICSVPRASYWSGFRSTRPTGTRWSARSASYAGGGYYRPGFGTPRVYRTGPGTATTFHATTGIAHPTRIQRFDAATTVPRQTVPTYSPTYTWGGRGAGGAQTLPETGRRTFGASEGQRPFQTAPAISPQPTPRFVEGTPRWTPPQQPDATRSRATWPNQNPGGWFFRRPETSASLPDAARSPSSSSWPFGGPQRSQVPALGSWPRATWPQAGGWSPFGREAVPTPTVRSFPQVENPLPPWNRNAFSPSNPQRNAFPVEQGRAASSGAPAWSRPTGDGDGGRRHHRDGRSD